ncbi:MAG: DUF3253 domain-containing protein [Pseudomonadota bacterium]
MAEPDAPSIRKAILTLVAERGEGKTICPSEAARLLTDEDWRRLMPKVREAAIRLAKDGAIIITRKGKVVDPDNFKGVYRLGVSLQEAGDGEAA